MLVIWLARKAILRGDWQAHRRLMLGALAFWGSTLALFAFYLYVRGLRVLIAVPEVIFGLYVVSVVMCAAMLGLTLLRLFRHQYLPHKILARKTILVWLWTCLFGIFFYPLTDAHIYPVAG